MKTPANTTIGSMTAAIMLIALCKPAVAFISGSTGADGAFHPTQNTVLQLPPSGIFNFTEVTIPGGVTVTFAKNQDNTPVTFLVSGDVTIDGAINLNGGNGGAFNNSSPGEGGPGGFDGGYGGWYASSGQAQGGDGQGPGRGTGAPNVSSWQGGGGSYGTSGRNGNVSGSQGRAGPTYGTAALLSLIGGSGGGGAAGGGYRGPGGGGGGGAILIAASGTVTSNGVITARGGGGGTAGLSGHAGAGSGGAIRIMATTLKGEGVITAQLNADGINGGDGRIRLEAGNLLRTSNTTPLYTYSQPGQILVPNLPALRIASVSGIDAPANPTGSGDIELPGVTTNPATVTFETSNVPPGTVIVLTAAPERGTAVTANSDGVAGTLAAGTASADINLPNGRSVLTAQANFNVTVAMGEHYSRYAQGERVERVEVSYVPGQGSRTSLITVSGAEYSVPSNALSMN